MKRRQLLGLGSLSATFALAGCGFRLRGAPTLAFTSLYLASTTPLAEELRGQLASGGAVQVITSPAPLRQAQVVLELLGEKRSKVVVGRGATGQVREFQLGISLSFRLRTPDGLELIAETELAEQREISFSETQVLAKEGEEALLYQDMQSDLVRQLMRRLAAIRSL